MITSDGTCKLVMPLSELTMAKGGREASVSAKVASIAVRSASGMPGNLATKSPRPLLKFTPAASKAAPCWSSTGLTKVRTAAPNKMGSDTFIMVAFMCNEYSAPSAWMRPISSVKNASSLAMDMAAQSTISPSCSARPPFKTVRVPSSATCTMSAVVAAGKVTLCSEPKKSPSVMLATRALLSDAQAPMRCGCFLAYALTALGARRSLLPSRNTGFTADPFTLS